MSEDGYSSVHFELDELMFTNSGKRRNHNEGESTREYSGEGERGVEAYYRRQGDSAAKDQESWGRRCEG